MKVLIAFECSGVVREAFRRRGHDAWSCDLKPAEDGSPNHIQGDAMPVIRQPWQLIIAHPPCDYLTVSGNSWFLNDAVAGPGILTGGARREAQRAALNMVLGIWDCPCARLAIENPIGRLSTMWRKPTQIIQPFYFGAPHQKATCLWLRGLPPLMRTHVPAGDWFAERQPETIRQTSHLMGPSPTRKADRARTYPEVAEAMANQWSAECS